MPYLFVKQNAFSIQSLTPLKTNSTLYVQVSVLLSYLPRVQIAVFFVAYYVVSSVACLAIPYFVKLSRKILIDMKCVLVFCIPTVIRNFSHSKNLVRCCGKLIHVSNEVPNIFDRF